MNILSKTECSALRGIAIIGIFMHNYIHWLGPMVKENEYQFKQSNVDWMMSLIGQPSWELILQFFSFFGHYGVPVFLFLSGYGLVLKYENSSTGTSKEESCWKFIKHHYLKLFPMMLLGFVVFAMVDWMTPGRHHWTWLDIITQLTMTINLFPQPDKIIWPGPYWFFGLMMQLYLFYRLALYKRHWGIIVGAIALCWMIQALHMDDPAGDAINRIRYNFIGGMLPFGMGILIARYQDKIHGISRGLYLGIFATSLLAVLCMSLSFHAWLWVPLFVVTLHIGLVKILPKILINGLDWVGILSSAIFVCHPITRKIFIPISRRGDLMDGIVIYIVATIVLAMLFRYAINAIKEGGKK